MKAGFVFKKPALNQKCKDKKTFKILFFYSQQQLLPVYFYSVGTKKYDLAADIYITLWKSVVYFISSFFLIYLTLFFWATLLYIFLVKSVILQILIGKYSIHFLNWNTNNLGTKNTP